MYPIEKIEGVGKVYGAKLRAAGIKDTGGLLKACAKPKDRDALATATGLSGKLILKWANRADLMRVKGVGEEYADLLEAAGVDTVPELAQRRADSLHTMLMKTQGRKQLVRQPPALKTVEGWIVAAKEMERVLHY